MYTLDFMEGRGTKSGSLWCLASIVILSAFFCPGIATQASSAPLITYDLSRDFSSNSNPVGVWSYGWKSNFSGAFNVYTFRRKTIDIASPPGAYMDNWARFNDDGSQVMHNGTSLTAIGAYGQAVFPPGTVVMIPGNNGREDGFAVVRFTAPAPGTYRISSFVQNMYHGDLSGDTDFHVLRNGVELFGQFIAADTGWETHTSGYTNEVTLETGSTVDLLTGRGLDGSFEGSGLTIQASISLLQTNPPTTNTLETTNVFDLSNDFSPSSNPAGLWSYGWKSNFTGPFNIYTFSRKTLDPASPPGAYMDNWARFNDDGSQILHNGTALTAIGAYGQAVYPPGTIVMLPGNNGRADNFAVARFTAPATGIYMISSAIQNMFHGNLSGDADFHVLRDGVELFGQVLPPDNGSETNSSGYTNVISLGTGSTVELLVGRGLDGEFNGSGLKVQATISLLSTGAVAPWIIQEPLRQTVLSGGNLLLTVIAAGSSPLRFQWQFNGTNLSNTTWLNGATESILRMQNIQPANAGSYCVVVSNDYGAVTSAWANLTVHNPPAVGITTPGDGSPFLAPADILISADVFDSDDTVARVHFYAQSSAPDSLPVLLGTITNAAASYFSAQLPWRSVAAERYTLTATAIDSLGASATSAPVSILVRSPEPLILLTSPPNDAAFGSHANIALSANAADADGTVARVEFFAGTNLVGTVTSRPFNFTWSNVSDGAYTLTARATDNSGVVGFSTPINITVGNVSSLPVFRFAQADYQVGEGATFVKVTVLKNVSIPASVTFSTSDNSATASSGDYGAMSGRLDFAEGQTSSTITIPIYEDSQIEAPETFTISLSAPTAGGTLGEPGTATITILDNDGKVDSCLDIAPPAEPPPSSGSLCIDLDPPEAQGQWRLAWETSWHNGSTTLFGLPVGNYTIEFKPVGYFDAPFPAVVPVGTNGLVRQTFYYMPTGLLEVGSVGVKIQPNDVATNSEIDFRGQWRLEGELPWHESGDTLTNVTVGVYTVQFKPIPGRVTPSDVQVQVVSGQINLAQATYLIANPFPTEANISHPLTFAQITNSYASRLPYAFCGQIKSDVGWGSGFVVKDRVVLTAAHVVFDDASLSYVGGVRWFFQKQAGLYEPVPQTPRGWYLFSGYAAQRAIDNSPGISSPVSQNLDVAALYFLEPAGRGGYGGYLVSEPDSTEWLLQAAQKILVGYPVTCTTECSPGQMHATDPANASFAPYFGRLFRSSDIGTFPGNSGGPLCVQHTNGYYYPAGIYVGGSGETIVRAIDGTVVDLLINRAEIASHGGDNGVGGGVVKIISNFGADPFCTGWVEVHLWPPSAINAGAAWRVSPNNTLYSAYTNFTGQVRHIPVQYGSFTIEFKDLPGFRTPTNGTVQVSCEQGVALYPTYQVLAPNLHWAGENLVLSGTRGTSYRLDLSDGLPTSSNWIPVATVTLTNGNTPVSGLTRSNLGSRFFRARWIP